MQEDKIVSLVNKLRAILNSSTDYNIYISPTYEVLSFNEAAKKFIGQVYGKVIEEGQYILDYILDDSLAEFKADFAKALEGEQVYVEKEISFETSFLWFKSSFIPVYDGDKKIIGVTYNATNIDSHKRAEEKLRQSEYILRAIYHSSTEANTFISPSYKILHFNKVAAEMSKELLGFYPKVDDDYSDYLLPHWQEEMKSYFDRALQGETVEIEKVNGITWYRFIFFPVYDQEGTLTGVAANIKDITRRKNNELRIARQNEKLLAIAWQQAHGVRRPLANILGLINLIRAETDNSFLPTYINYLQVAADELDAIIHKIVNDTQDI